MALALTGDLTLAGDLDLVADGGTVTASGADVLVELPRGSAAAFHGTAPVLVPLPGPPSDPGLNVWIFKSLNQTVTIDGVPAVVQGECAQGIPGSASWPGTVDPSAVNTTVKIESNPANVVGDLGTITATGAKVPFTHSGQGVS